MMQMNANKKNKTYLFLPNMGLIWETRAHWEMGGHRSGLVLSKLAQNDKNWRLSKYKM